MLGLLMAGGIGFIGDIGRRYFGGNYTGEEIQRCSVMQETNVDVFFSFCCNRKITNWILDVYGTSP